MRVQYGRSGLNTLRYSSHGLETIESQRNLSQQNEESKDVAGEKKKRAFTFSKFLA